MFYVVMSFFFFFQAEAGIRVFCLSRGLGDVYKRQDYWGIYDEAEAHLGGASPGGQRAPGGQKELF